LVISHREYNIKSGLAIVCPMTSKTDKPWPFLVGVGEDSAVIADQIKCLDWRSRRAEVKGRLANDVVERVVALCCRLIQPVQ